MAQFFSLSVRQWVGTIFMPFRPDPFLVSVRDLPLVSPQENARECRLGSRVPPAGAPSTRSGRLWGHRGAAIPVRCQSSVGRFMRDQSTHLDRRDAPREEKGSGTKRTRAPPEPRPPQTFALPGLPCKATLRQAGKRPCARCPLPHGAGS